MARGMYMDIIRSLVGLVTRNGHLISAWVPDEMPTSSSAAVPVPRPEEIQEVYEIRAALEEIAGRAAARALKGNTSALRREVDDMRAAFRRDLDCFVEHDVAFHRHILQASQNQTLV